MFAIYRDDFIWGWLRSDLIKMSNQTVMSTIITRRACLAAPCLAQHKCKKGKYVKTSRTYRMHFFINIFLKGFWNGIFGSHQRHINWKGGAYQNIAKKYLNSCTSNFIQVSLIRKLCWIILFWCTCFSIYYTSAFPHYHLFEPSYLLGRGD